MSLTPRSRWQFPVDIPPPRITPPGTRRPVATEVVPVYCLTKRKRDTRLEALGVGCTIGIGLFCWILAISVLVHYFRTH
jgi:hypothetical protein